MGSKAEQFDKHATGPTSQKLAEGRAPQLQAKSTYPDPGYGPDQGLELSKVLKLAKETSQKGRSVAQQISPAGNKDYIKKIAAGLAVCGTLYPPVPWTAVRMLPSIFC